MPKIRMLSQDVIGKIAAGEVVERPAAAIKELVENSLDAGASAITVEIQEGGLESFKVTDDGCGIDESDIRLAFERHATSKIRSEDDLNSIGTLGFRGEALASIAAVGKVTLTTRTSARETGIRVQNNGGQIESVSEIACAPGTGISVKELFFNVPVRKGFMKKPAAETNMITELMTRFILSRPDVSFRYLSNGKQIYHSPGDGKTESALLSIYGPRAVRAMRIVNGHENGVVVKGYIGIGENARGNRSGENFFINGRMMRSNLLCAAMEDGCRERVMIGKFPICALYLDMPYENVNVNVHPNKLEVQFRDEYGVRLAVFHSVQEALKERDAFQRPVEMPLVQEKQGPDCLPPVITPLNIPRNVEENTSETVPDIQLKEKPVPVYRPVERGVLPPSYRPVLQPDLLPPPYTDRSALKEREKTEKSIDGREWLEQKRPEDTPRGPSFNSELEEAVTSVEKNWNLPSEMIPSENSEQIEALISDAPKEMKVLGAVFNTFIVIEYEDHLLLIDQHAVHERLLFDKMMKEYEEQNVGQEMLVPYILPVTRKDIAVLEENRNLLESLGLKVDPFSETEVAVRSVPVLLGENETEMFLREAIDELTSGRIPGYEKKRAMILQMACKHAIKGGEPLSNELMRSLVEEMIDKKVTPTCPHGRPLVVSISHRELDRKFKRIQ